MATFQKYSHEVSIQFSILTTRPSVTSPPVIPTHWIFFPVQRLPHFASFQIHPRRSQTHKDQLLQIHCSIARTMWIATPVPTNRCSLTFPYQLILLEVRTQAIQTRRLKLTLWRQWMVFLSAVAKQLFYWHPKRFTRTAPRSLVRS